MNASEHQEEVEDCIQSFRRLKLSQVRAQLEEDANGNIDGRLRFAAVRLFVELAKDWK